MSPSIPSHIEITPGVCGGKPRIAGHRITVQNIAIWHQRMGMTPDEIVAGHSGITLADVYAALAFYFDHRNEIDQQLREDEEFVARLQAQSPPSLLLEKLNGQNGATSTLPSG